MVKKAYAGLAISAMFLFGSDVASAASVTASSASAQVKTLTLGQIDEMYQMLKALSKGTPDQCDKKAEPSASDRPVDLRRASGPPTPTCPFILSRDLLNVISHDLVVLQPFEEEFEIQINTIRVELLSNSNDSEILQSSKFALKAFPIQGTKRDVEGLWRTKMDDFNLGQPPKANRISPDAIAALSPIIDDFAETQGKQP